MREDEQQSWERGRWWRVLSPDGSLWAETSSESDARSRMRPGDTLQNLRVRHEERWFDES